MVLLLLVVSRVRAACACPRRARTATARPAEAGRAVGDAGRSGSEQVAHGCVAPLSPPVAWTYQPSGLASAALPCGNGSGLRSLSTSPFDSGARVLSPGRSGLNEKPPLTAAVTDGCRTWCGRRVASRDLRIGLVDVRSPRRRSCRPLPSAACRPQDRGRPCRRHRQHRLLPWHRWRTVAPVSPFWPLSLPTSAVARSARWMVPFLMSAPVIRLLALATPAGPAMTMAATETPAPSPMRAFLVMLVHCCLLQLVGFPCPGGGSTCRALPVTEIDSIRVL